MQTPVRFILVCPAPYFFVTKVIKHSIKAYYATIFLINCDNIITLAAASSY
jgi:hypothetical protein